MEDAVKMEYLKKRRRFTLEEKTFILEKTNSRCGHCGKHLELAEATLDHIIPLNKGGLNDEYNLLPLCLKCNESKSNYVYDVGDYYEYILPQYQEVYRKYHTFAKHELDKKTLYGYSLEQFVTYPLKHQQIINQMIERKAKPKKIKEITRKLGVHFFLERAYAGDAIDIMKLINKIISNDDIFVDESLYANDYMVLNEIKDGEVYVLRSHVDSTLHGVLLFKKTTYEEMPEQIQNIADETKMSIKYIMTGVFLDYFSEDVLEDLMGSVRRKFLNSRIVPIYFNVLSQIFAAKDAFIAIPYTLDKYDGKLECFPSSYIKEEFRENLVDFIDIYQLDELDELDELEIDLLVEAIFSLKTQDDIPNANKEIQNLFKNHPDLESFIMPSHISTYGVGFLDYDLRSDIYFSKEDGKIHDCREEFDEDEED